MKSYYEIIPKSKIFIEIDGNTYAHSHWEVTPGWTGIQKRLISKLLRVDQVVGDMVWIRIARTGNNVKTLYIPGNSGIILIETEDNAR